MKRREGVRVDYRGTDVDFIMPPVKLTIRVRVIPGIGDHVYLDDIKWMVADIVHHPQQDGQPIEIHLVRSTM